MKTKYTLFRRNGIYYSQDSATGQQKSLRTRAENEAWQLIHATNEAHRQPALNLHLARAYLTASDPAFIERTWQTVMEQLQARGKPTHANAMSIESFATAIGRRNFAAWLKRIRVSAPTSRIKVLALKSRISWAARRANTCLISSCKLTTASPAG
jgi:hypothetical protein